MPYHKCSDVFYYNTDVEIETNVQKRQLPLLCVDAVLKAFKIGKSLSRVQNIMPFLYVQAPEF